MVIDESGFYWLQSSIAMFISELFVFLQKFAYGEERRKQEIWASEEDLCLILCHFVLCTLYCFFTNISSFS